MRQPVTWLNGVMLTEPKNDQQRKVVGGRLNFWTDEASIDKFCDQLKAMAAMHRDVGEDFLSIDMMRNAPEKKLAFDFKRSEWSKDDSLASKIEAWKQQADGDTSAKPAAEPAQDDPFNDDDIGF